jgi:hypothetical protein
MGIEIMITAERMYGAIVVAIFVSLFVFDQPQLWDHSRCAFRLFKTGLTQSAQSYADFDRATKRCFNQLP